MILNEKRISIQSNLNSYLQEIGKYPVLTRNEETRYFEKMKTGDQEVRSFLIKCNLKLVVNIAKHYTFYNVSMMDLIQEGNLGLLKAIDKFDCTRGFKFSTYASQWIMQYITRFIQEKSTNIHLPAHLFEKRNRLYRLHNQLRNELKREPSIKELSAKSTLSIEQINAIMALNTHTISIDTPIDDENDTCLLDLIEDKTSLSPTQAFEYTYLKENIAHCLQSLNDREKDIIMHRFALFGYDYKTLEEMGEKYHITRERVRQIECTALRKLATKKEIKILHSNI